MAEPPVAADLIEVAQQVADASGRVIMRWFRSPDLPVARKADGTYVTAADREAEAAMRAVILEARPGDGIIGEEGSDVASTTGLTWVLDPIDGTMSFVHGVPLFSTLVAVRDGAGTAVGLIHAPALRETAVAGRGLGCTVNGLEAATSGVSSLNQATMLTSGLADYWPAPILHRLLESGALVRTWADGAYGYLLLAAGRVDAMVDGAVRVWDIAAAECIVPEAGGTVTRVDVGSDTGFVATNGPLHEQVLSLV